MKSPSPLNIVDAYLDAIAKRDLTRARAYLADQGFEYLSPINSFSSADQFIAYMELASPIMQHVEIRKVFADGDEVCHILTVTSQISEKRIATVVQWSRVAAAKINRVELVFDAHEYKMLLV
jgi:limonene-1,2-epoxide hydrolase